MSGHQFVETLRLIGYPEVDRLNGASFDWLFEEEATLPFLSRFCSTVGQQNALTQEEAHRFSELESAGVSLLEGQLLEDALQCFGADDQLPPAETPQEEVLRLEEMLHRQISTKQRLVQSRNTLSLHQSALNHRLSKFCDVERMKRLDYRQISDQCRIVNTECNAGLHHLQKSLQRLSSFCADKSQWCKSDDAAYLSQANLDEFHRIEENYTRQMAAYTTRLFFEGIGDIAGGEVTRYQLLKVSDPRTLLVKGPSQENYDQDCQELARLQKIFPKSEIECINAWVESQCAEAVVKAANTIFQNILKGHFSENIEDLSSELQEVRVDLAEASKELLHLTEKEVAPLVKELGKLHGMQVLTGDYKLKLTRQDYFVSNQDKVIRQLINQRARNELLTMGYECEAQGHRGTKVLLQALHDKLKDLHAQHNTRLKAMGTAEIQAKARCGKNTVDTADTFTTRLHRMLVVPAEVKSPRRQTQLYLSYQHLEQGAQNVYTEHFKALAQAKGTAQKYHNKVHDFETVVQRCEEILYSESSTVGGPPVNMSRSVMETFTQLNDLLHKLEAAIIDIVSDVNHKKRTLKKDPLLVKERELFTYFFNNPGRLDETIASMEAQLQAHQVK